MNHPDISQVAIIGVNDDKWGETGLAFVIPKEEGQLISIENIQEFLKDKIARYKHPAKIKMMTELPLTATMKVKKSELKDKYAMLDN